MSKISERLEVYQTQMSIYAEQHILILASDVLDMIEQLQDDLKDTVDKVIKELERKKRTSVECLGERNGTGFNKVMDLAINIVKRGSVE